MASIEREEQHPGKPSLYSCPECQGVLWELEDEDLLRFRCRIGHAYTADALE
ncbi:MAG: chemotaxis protein CheB, partial [Acidobacteria bacterium]|nr:chemotaxis protein CheB [Acidobacteriota bacterium]